MATDRLPPGSTGDELAKRIYPTMTSKPHAEGAGPRPEISLKPTEGLHCTHSYYRFDRAQLRGLGPSELRTGCEEFMAALTPESSPVSRLQTLIVSGHKADFGLIALDADPLVVDGVHQRLTSGLLGPALVPTSSFVSITEVSEYVPSLEQFRDRLAGEGLDPGGEEFRTKLEQYERRMEIMRRARVKPDLPAWPAVCFYPMNKKRTAEANWFLLDFAERQRMMVEHGASGMKFAGKVTQLVTVALGLDNWEWGVTLWARNPELLTQIVYQMRFDEASARYAEFGDFHIGYLAGAAEILKHCHIGSAE